MEGIFAFLDLLRCGYKGKRKQARTMRMLPQSDVYVCIMHI